MNVHAIHHEEARLRAVLVASLKTVSPELCRLAVVDDREATFPRKAFSHLRGIGLTRAVLPLTQGGAALGIDRTAVATLLSVLTLLGGAHLSLARLFEGHVNAFALLWSYGSPVQRQRLVHYVRDGGLLGVWNAPAPDGPLRLVDDGDRFRLSGAKIYASGAGSIARPLLTAVTEDGRLLMVWCDVSLGVVDLSGWRVHGMRSTDTGTISLDGVAVGKDDLFGADQDYHRQPAFSGGAWRFVAAQLGAAGALVDLLKDGLTRSGRDSDPHQRARLAQAAMLLESGRLWTQAASRIAEDPGAAPLDVAHYVGMARLVVEQTAMDLIALVQRSVGLRAMLDDNPIERISRDLATYVRQPVPDAIRDEAAAGALTYEGPLLNRWTL